MIGTLALILFGLISGYAFGCIPVGYFVGRIYGVDVRQHGSGRTGGSNVLRTIGWKAFFFTILGDILKGVVPVVLVTHVVASESAPAAAATVLGVLIGNNWSLLIAVLARPPRAGEGDQVSFVKRLFAQAKGGVGIMTTAGAALAIYWPAVLPLALVGLAMLLIFRYASLASVTVAILYPVAMGIFVIAGMAPLPYFVMSMLAAAIVTYVLLPNLQRLRAGNERKFGERVTTRQ